MDRYNKLCSAVVNGEDMEVQRLVDALLAQEFSPLDILNFGMIPGMSEVGEAYQKGEVFLPEMLVSAKAMKAGLKILRPVLSQANIKLKRKAVLGTVKGDLHDIGKNIAASVFEGAGYEVIDLGIDVSNDEFVTSVKRYSPDVLGMSSLLTITMINMEQVVKAIKSQKVNIKIVVGGAAVSQDYANKIGADVYAQDAVSGVKNVSLLLEQLTN